MWRKLLFYAFPAHRLTRYVMCIDKVGWMLFPWWFGIRKKMMQNFDGWYHTLRGFLLKHVLYVLSNFSCFLNIKTLLRFYLIIGLCYAFPNFIWKRASNSKLLVWKIYFKVHLRRNAKKYFEEGCTTRVDTDHGG